MKKNEKLNQRRLISEGRRDDRKVIVVNENHQKMNVEKDFVNIRNDRRRQHSFLNFQNTWNEDKIGIKVDEIEIPERIVIQPWRK